MDFRHCWYLLPAPGLTTAKNPPLAPELTKVSTSRILDFRFWILGLGTTAIYHLPRLLPPLVNFPQTLHTQRDRGTRTFRHRFQRAFRHRTSSTSPAPNCPAGNFSQTLQNSPLFPLADPRLKIPRCPRTGEGLHTYELYCPNLHLPSASISVHQGITPGSLAFHLRTTIPKNCLNLVTRVQKNFGLFLASKMAVIYIYQYFHRSHEFYLWLYKLGELA